jgi:hypothetical protein
MQLQRDTKGNITASDIIAHDYGSNTLPKVVFIEPDADTTDRLVVIHARDDIPATYRLYCDYVSIPEQVGWATAKTIANAIFRNAAPDAASDDNIGRALTLGLSLAQRNNVMAIGLDEFREEIILQLEKQFPDSPNLVIFLTAFTVDVVQEGYKHAFYEMSGFRN